MTEYGPMMPGDDLQLHDVLTPPEHTRLDGAPVCQ
jgi:hypothetical protein